MLFKDTEIGKRLNEDANKVLRLSQHPNITEEQLGRLLKVMEKIVEITERLVEEPTKNDEVKTDD